MRDLSVKGIAQTCSGLTGDISLREWLQIPFSGNSLWDCPSLRRRLENKAREERADVLVNNCPDIVTDIITTAVGSGVGALIGSVIGGALGGPPGAALGAALGAMLGGDWGYHEGFLIKWRAKFQQTWTHIVVRIRVIWLADASNQSRKLDLWKEQIETTWSYRWGCRRAGIIDCPFTFEVQWLEGEGQEEHHLLLFVTDEMDRAAYFWWDNQGAAWPAVHEFGHIIGLADEYVEDGYPCPGRDDPNDPSVRGNDHTLMGISPHNDWFPADQTIAEERSAINHWQNYLASNVNDLFPPHYFSHFASYLDCELINWT